MDMAACTPLMNAVFERILDNWLQNQARDEHLLRFLRNVPRHVKTFGEAHSLDLEILSDELEFLSEWHLADRRRREDVSQDIAQLRENAHCCAVVVLAYQAGNCIETVEQEVRIQLH